MTNQTTIIRFDGNYFSYTDSSGNLVRIPAISGKTDSQNSQFQNVVVLSIIFFSLKPKKFFYRANDNFQLFQEIKFKRGARL